jgi:hypothetical protein
MTVSMDYSELWCLCSTVGVVTVQYTAPYGTIVHGM